MYHLQVQCYNVQITAVFDTAVQNMIVKCLSYNCLEPHMDICHSAIHTHAYCTLLSSRATVVFSLVKKSNVV